MSWTCIGVCYQLVTGIQICMFGVNVDSMIMKCSWRCMLKTSSLGMTIVGHSNTVLLQLYVEMTSSQKLHRKGAKTLQVDARHTEHHEYKQLAKATRQKHAGAAVELTDPPQSQ